MKATIQMLVDNMLSQFVFSVSVDENTTMVSASVRICILIINIFDFVN